MGQPIKISDDLALAAREEADVCERSIASQVEHWARIGRAAEQVLGHGQVVALKRRAALPEFSEAMREATCEAGQRKALRHLAKLGAPRFGVDPDRPGFVIRIDPDGSRTHGRFVNRQFVAAEE